MPIRHLIAHFTQFFHSQPSPPSPPRVIGQNQHPHDTNWAISNPNVSRTVYSKCESEIWLWLDQQVYHLPE